MPHDDFNGDHQGSGSTSGQQVKILPPTRWYMGTGKHLNPSRRTYPDLLGVAFFLLIASLTGVMIGFDFGERTYYGITRSSPPRNCAVTIRSLVETMSVCTLELLKPSRSHSSLLTSEGSPA